jgi:hypothetical protein
MSNTSLRKRILTAFAILFLLLVAFLTSVYFAIRSPKVQTFIAQKVTEALSDKFDTHISIEKVEIEFFNRILIKNLYIEDQRPDTLLHVGFAEANFNYFYLFSRKISLNNLEIKNVNIEMHRSDADQLFNFEKIFKQEGKTPSPKVKKEGQDPWKLKLNDMNFSEIKYSLIDSLKGSSVYVNAPNIALNYKKFDLENLIIDISYLTLTRPSVLVDIFEACSITEPQPFSLDLPLTVTGDKINIEQGKFRLVNYKDTSSYQPGKFAPNFIDIKNIELLAQKITILNDSIYVNFQKLALEDRSGFSIKRMKTHFSMSNQYLGLEKLNIQTPKSIIGDNISLEYSSFEDFQDFLRNVRINANFANTVIDPRDITYFADLKDIKLRQPIHLDGDFSGTVSNLRSRSIAIRFGKRSSFQGSLSLMGLPNIQQTFISFRVEKLVSDYQEALSIYNKIPFGNNFRKLGRINFSGRFDGFITDFVAYGKLKTEIGSMDLDVNFKFSDRKVPLYSGIFNMKQFNIGKFLEQPDMLGYVSLKAKIKGKGLNINTLDANLDGIVDSIDIKGYRYKNIHVDGSVKDRFFEGQAEIDDTYLKLDFNGLVDAREKIPHFNFNADIKEIHLKPLNLLNVPWVVSTNLKTNFSASSVNDILGSLLIQNTTITNNNREYFIDRIAINSNQLANKDRQLRIVSGNLDANIRGNFIFTEIPKAIKKIMLPNFDEKVDRQVIKFDIKINDDNNLLSLFVPKLNLPKEATISGNFNTASESLLAVIDVPFIQYGDFSALRFNSNIFVSKENINIINSLPVVYVKDSVLVENITLLADGSRKDTRFRLNIFTPKQNSTANIVAHLTTKNSKSELRFEKSNLNLNQTRWFFDQNNVISFEKDLIKSENLKIFSGNSQLKADIFADKNVKSLDVQLKNLNLYDFTGFFRRKNIEINGIANGNIHLDISDKTPSFSGNLVVNDIEVNNYKVGDLMVRSAIDLPNKKVKINGSLAGNENDIIITGAYSFAETPSEKDFDINFRINKFAIKSIDDFIAEYIENTKGVVMGNLKLQGFRNKPNLIGYIDIDDVTTTVSYLKTTYNIKRHRVTFDENVINLGNRIRVTDMEGNVAFGNGRITHNHFKDLRLDIRVTSDRIMALNTTVQDNEIFYGKAYLKGGVNFTGLTTDVNIYVYGESEAVSNIEIPLGESGGAGSYTFFTFIEKNVDEDLKLIQSGKSEVAKIKGLSVRLDLVVDRDLTISIILDQAAGDVLKASGNGNITIDVSKGGEEVNFFGNYIIADGDYLFTLQNVINKRFRIEPNSSIQFNGPIEDAIINVEAVYSLRSSTYNLIQEFLDPNNLDEISYANNRVPIKLYLLLSEKLYSPKIGFDIRIEQIDPTLRNYVDGKLQTIQMYENELNRQVFGLLVLNQFLPFTGGIDNQLAGQTTFTSGAANTVSEFLSNQLSRYFNDWLSYLADDLDFSINYRNYGQTTTDMASDEAFLQRRRELQLALSKKFLNDRITLNVGGNVDFGQEDIQTEANTTFFGGDFSVEYAFTRNRRFRMKAFTMSDYDYFSQANRTRAGVGLSFRKEFDKLRESRMTKDDFRLRDKPKETP